MGSIYDVEVTVESGKNLKNVNWRHGDLRPYVVAWVDPSAKVTTRVDVDNDDDPVWDEKVVAPIRGAAAIGESVLHIEVVHARNAEEEQQDVKPLVGSAQLPLREIVDEAGIGGKAVRTVKLKRPSGRPHGKIAIKVCVREPARYSDYPPPAQYGTPYGGRYGHSEPSGEYDGAYPYGAPPVTGYPYGGPPPPQTGYPYGGELPPPQQAEKKKSGFGGMGTGLAIGAGVGLVGGFALAEGLDHLEDEVAEEAAEEVEEDLACGGDDE